MQTRAREKKLHEEKGEEFYAVAAYSYKSPVYANFKRNQFNESSHSEWRIPISKGEERNEKLTNKISFQRLLEHADLSLIV